MHAIHASRPAPVRAHTSSTSSRGLTPFDVAQERIAVEAGSRRQIGFRDDRDVGGVEDRRVLQRFVLTFSHRDQHRAELLAQIVAGGAHEVSDVLDGHVSAGSSGDRRRRLSTGGKYDAAILADAVPRGGPPGTLYAIEPDVAAIDSPLDLADAHSVTPAAVLASLRHLGAWCGRVVIIGCEPTSIDESMDLSAPVAAAVDGAIRMVRDLVATMI